MREWVRCCWCWYLIPVLVVLFALTAPVLAAGSCGSGDQSQDCAADVSHSDSAGGADGNEEGDPDDYDITIGPEIGGRPSSVRVVVLFPLAHGLIVWVF